MHDKLLTHEEETFKLAWVTAVATAGGTVSLLLGELTILRVFFAAVGIGCTVALAIFAVSKDAQIRELVRRDRKETL